jgi:DNA-binding transcriptional regulator LsrR (DeoR family)
MYLECKTHDEIANETDMSRSRITEIINKVEKRIIAEIDNNPPDSLQIENLWD